MVLIKYLIELFNKLLLRISKAEKSSGQMFFSYFSTRASRSSLEQYKKFNVIKIINFKMIFTKKFFNQTLEYLKNYEFKANLERRGQITSSN